MAILSFPTSVLLFSLAIVPLFACQTYEDAVRLHYDLLTNHSMAVRPVADQSEPLVINLKFSLMSILELDEIVGKLSVLGIMTMIWEDYAIVWEPLDYGDINNTKLPITNVWTPNLIVVNPSGTVTSVGEDPGHNSVHYLHTGVALWAPAEVLSATCNIDITKYPFDTQTCEIFLTQWGSTTYAYQFISGKARVSTYYWTPNGDWDLIQATSRNDTIDDMFPMYIITLKLQRRTTYTLINIITPIVIASVLNLLVFIVPPESGERVSFATTILLAKAVFFTLVGDHIPRSSLSMARVFYLILTNFILSFFIMTTVVVNLRIYHAPAASPVPSCFIPVINFTNCKRGRHSKVQDGPSDCVPRNTSASELEDTEITDRPDESSDAVKVTWADVSTALDKLCGIISVVWLFISITTYFSIVL